MYAKIENEATKLCSVGVGTDTAFYESIGMTEMDVEEAYDGKWYIKGYAPEKPQSIINQERIAELKANIAATDSVVLEMAENALLNGGNLVMTMDDNAPDYLTVLQNRASWRSELKTLTEV